VLQQQADLQGLISNDTNPGLQAFQINVNLGDVPDDDDSEESSTERSAERSSHREAKAQALTAAGARRLTHGEYVLAIIACSSNGGENYCDRLP
jgi:hypothetical protein